MAKELTLVLRVKNAMQVGLSKAMATLRGFGSSVMTVGKWIGGAFIAGGAAIGAFTAKALSAYAVQEQATASLRASLRAYGDEVDANTARIESIASAIQNETAAADENIVARAARLRMLGVETQAMEGALRATVALEAAGMAEEAAIKAVAMAQQGNYSMLQRYIPALRQATSDTERAVIVNDFLRSGYEQQQAVLNTVGGRWKEFKGRIGDVWEAFGGIIARNGMITRLLALASEKVKAFGEAILQWADSERFKEIQNSIEGIVNALIKGGESRTQAIGLLGELLKASLARGAEVAGAYLMEIAPKIGKLIGAGARAAMGTVAKQNAMKQAASEMGIETGPLFGAFGMFTGSVTAEQKKQIEARAVQLQQEELFRDLGLQTKTAIEGQTAAQVALAGVTQALMELGKEHGQIIVNTAQTQAKATGDMITVTRRAEQEISDAIEDRADTEEDTLDDIIEMHRDAGEEISDVWGQTADYSVKAMGKLSDVSLPSANDAVESSASRGGTFTTSGIGPYSNTGLANGTRIITPERGMSYAGGSFVTASQEQLRVWQEMNNNLKGIRKDNEQLLTMG